MIQVLPILSFDSSNFFLLGSLIWGGRRRYSNVFIGTNLFLIWLKDELKQLPIVTWLPAPLSFKGASSLSVLFVALAAVGVLKRL